MAVDFNKCFLIGMVLITIIITATTDKAFFFKEYMKAAAEWHNLINGQPRTAKWDSVQELLLQEHQYKHAHTQCYSPNRSPHIDGQVHTLQTFVGCGDSPI